MNTKQAKALNMIHFLHQVGYHPVKENDTQAWFFSPFSKNEKSPSFKVNKKLNLFYCFSSGEKGTIIDLGTRLFNCSISEFLEDLNRFHFSFRQQETVIESPPTEVIKTLPISNPNLINYAKERGICAEIVKRHCKEVTFNINGKSLYGIGFENSKGGLEIRNKFYKGCIAPKAITHLKNGSTACSIFEGFFDFLSFLILKKDGFTKTDFIILNSTSFVNDAIQISNDYKTVFLFLDNDESGKKTTLRFKTELGIKAIDYSFIYKNNNDLNDYLINQKQLLIKIKTNNND